MALSEEVKFKSNIERLEILIKDPIVQALYRPSINRQLYDMVKRAKVISEITNNSTKTMEAKKTYQPKEKLYHQWQPKSFKKTKKERKSKKKSSQHVYPSFEKKEQLLAMLESNVQVKEEKPIKEESKTKANNSTYKNTKLTSTKKATSTKTSIVPALKIDDLSSTLIRY